MTLLLRAIALVPLLCLLVVPRAWASEPPSVHDDEDIELDDEALGPRGNMRTRAESVSFDAKQRSLELAGNVRIDAPPFHLRSPHITLARTRWGIEADGRGRLAFCPCLGTPLTIEFDKAIVAPPGELLLRNPKLEFYGVPILWLPWFWLRGGEKVGVLPPEIAYRGQDGMFLGAGVHLPWKNRGAARALDVRGGAYLIGGFAADARLRTPTSTTKIRFDRLPGARAPRLRDVDGTADDGLLVDARGSSAGELGHVAWDADILRGRRGVVAATDLDAAAKPWDRAWASAAVELGPIHTETGFRAVTRRGGDLRDVEASGPYVGLRSSGALGTHVTYDANIEGGALRVSGNAASALARAAPSITPDSVSYARAEVGMLAATSFGPMGASLRARGASDVAAEGRANGTDRAGTARLRLGAPVARSFTSVEPNDPFVHVVEPFAGATVLHGSGDALLGTRPGRGLASLRGTAPIMDAGVTSTLGRWAKRDAIEVSGAGGAAYVVDDTLRPLVRARLSATLDWFGAQVDSAHVVERGSAVMARARLGAREGVRVALNVATRDGLDPVLARTLTDAELEAPAGFLSREGTTGGAGLVVPWSHAITTSVGADADATNQELVGARAGFSIRDKCRCLVLHANGSHRIGRSGVDVWVALDFVADR